MTSKQKLLKVFPYAVAVHELFWTIYEGNPVDQYELGFGRTERSAWAFAWRRYVARLSIVESSTTWEPRHSNH